MEYDDLIKFGKTYEYIDYRCSSIFKSIENLHKIHSPVYRESYDYDEFIVENEYITMLGSSYSHSGYDWGKTEHGISFKSFLNEDLFIAHLEAELIEKKRVLLEKSKHDKNIEEKKERELLAKLKQKYEK